MLSNNEEGISIDRLFKVLQPRIYPEERITWLIEYREKIGVEADLSLLRVNNLVLSQEHIGQELQLISSSFNYEEYLVRKYCKSSAKLASILTQLGTPHLLHESLTELQLSSNQIHLLSTYLRTRGETCLNKFREDENKATQEVSQQD
jgi:hypothetical protein